MKAFRRSGLILGTAMLCLAPLLAVNMGHRAGDPWPSLLAADPAGVDPNVAMLQLRASMALDRLLQSSHAAEQKS